MKKNEFEDLYKKFEINEFKDELDQRAIPEVKLSFGKRLKNFLLSPFRFIANKFIIMYYALWVSRKQARNFDEVTARMKMLAGIKHKEESADVKVWKEEERLSRYRNGLDHRFKYAENATSEHNAIIKNAVAKDEILAPLYDDGDLDSN